MAIGLKLPTFKDVSRKSKINIYNKPKYVYIPLISQNDTNITVLVKKNDYVYKGSIVGKRKGNLRIPIHSSVSGKVIDFEEKLCMNGQKVKCIKIENDFKEKIEEKRTVRKRINNVTKEEFVDILKDRGIIGLGGAGFPTYIKYDNDKKVDTLIINAVECEPYITADYVLVKEKCEEILEGIDAIVEINNAQEAIIAIRKGNHDLKKIFNNFIGTYLKIRIVEVPNLYPMGWERALVKYVKDINYERLPIERGIIVDNISTVYAIYEALKTGKPLIERVITFTGDVLKHPQNVLVKVGTPANEIIEHIGGYKRNKNIKFVAGGPMMGKSLSSDELIITGNLNCILALKDQQGTIPIECIRCGKCVIACPAKLSPVLIKDSLDDVDRLKELECHRCIECGLCSYICPSKINVREYVKQGKENISKRSN